jgi:hypothetical protein
MMKWACGELKYINKHKYKEKSVIKIETLVNKMKWLLGRAVKFRYK